MRARAAVVIGLVASAASTGHAGAQVPLRSPVAAKPFYDSRSARTPARPHARAAAGLSLTVDPRTGTARSLQALRGALSAPVTGDRARVARRWVRAHRGELGLTAADVDSLTPAERTLATGSGITTVQYRQAYRGIPAFDNGVRVNLDRGGRVLSVTGAPLRDVAVGSVVPALGATAALRALQRNVGVRRRIAVTSGPRGAQRSTRFGGYDTARLVLFGGAAGVRLAWHVTYEASSVAVYDAVVDARDGRILYRQNLVKFDAPATVYRNYPGASAGTATPDLEAEGWLTDASFLAGPWVHAYADIDDDGFDSSEEIPRTPAGDYEYPLQTFAAPSGWDDACDFSGAPQPGGWPAPLATNALCSWDPTDPGSWQDNRRQNAVQAFYLANVFQDHLSAAPIGFDEFTGNDRLRLETDDGAATGPDAAHLDNANMLTPAPGNHPRMQMYLFAYDPDEYFTYRDINGGDDAATVWHEYTHGMSGRLVHNPDGTPALSSAQSSAMSEGWSDWYALDLLVQSGLQPDAGTVGDVDIGRYSDAHFATSRYEPADCQAGVVATRCRGGAEGGAATDGFTFGDLGRVGGHPEAHADGEIWLQTLWDLRRALTSGVAETLITDGMRLSGPEPSFLDERNAILAADAGGTHRNAIWQVFAKRGMGWHANVDGSDDITADQDFTLPPTTTAVGRVSGTVTSADTGLPLAGVSVGLRGHPYGAVTDAAGRYSFQALATSYPALRFRSAGYAISATAVTVPGGGVVTRSVALRRNWAGSTGGAGVLTSGFDDNAAADGCGLGRLIDQDDGTGWSARTAGTRQAVVVLPRAITVSAFALDPGSPCGDADISPTAGYRIDTSADGQTWRTARTGAFTAAGNGRLNLVAPAANAAGVRYVRLTLTSGQQGGTSRIGFSELAVYGGPPNLLPEGTLVGAPANVVPGQTVTFAAAFTDADSRITGYDWDFDGNGTVDRSTTGPQTTFAYANEGTYVARVLAKDFRGGAGTGLAGVSVKVPTFTPTLSLPARGRKGKLTFSITCPTRCKLTGSLVLSHATAHKLARSTRRIRRISRSLRTTHVKKITLTLPKSVRRAARRHHVTRLTLRLTLTARTVDGRHRTRSKTVTVRL